MSIILSKDRETHKASFVQKNDFKLTWKHSQDAKHSQKSFFGRCYLLQTFLMKENVEVDQYVNTNFTFGHHFSLPGKIIYPWVLMRFISKCANKGNAAYITQ
jgi:hypothetical protein